MTFEASDFEDVIEDFDDGHVPHLIPAKVTANNIFLDTQFYYQEGSIRVLSLMVSKAKRDGKGYVLSLKQGKKNDNTSGTLKYFKIERNDEDRTYPLCGEAKAKDHFLDGQQLWVKVKVDGDVVECKCVTMVTIAHTIEGDKELMTLLITEQYVQLKKVLMDPPYRYAVPDPALIEAMRDDIEVQFNPRYGTKAEGKNPTAKKWKLVKVDPPEYSDEDEDDEKSVISIQSDYEHENDHEDVHDDANDVARRERLMFGVYQEFNMTARAGIQSNNNHMNKAAQFGQDMAKALGFGDVVHFADEIEGEAPGQQLFLTNGDDGRFSTPKNQKTIKGRARTSVKARRNPPPDSVRRPQSERKTRTRTSSRRTSGN